MSQHAFVPERSAFGTRRLIPARRPCAGVTKTEGDERDLCFVVEGRTIQIHPISQMIAARVVPGDTSLMDFAAWRLTDDQQTCGTRHAQYRPGTVLKMGCTDPASTDFAQQP